MDLLGGKIGKLYRTLLFSALGSTLVTNIYSMVDIICVGQYTGDAGSSAIACLNPFWPIMLGLGLLFGMGGAVMMANKRGMGDRKESDEFFTLGFTLTAISAVVVFFVFLFLREPLLVIFGAKEPEILALSLDYIYPIMFAAPTFTLSIMLSSFIRNDGEAFLPTFATAIGGVVNIFGDIFFVFDFGLGLGIFGAGLATSLGQATGFVILCTYFFRKKCTLKFTKVSKIPSKLLKICGVGASALMLEASFALTSAIFNNTIIDKLSESHLAVYGAASSLLILFYVIFYSFGTALQPIASTNFGAGKITRVKKTLKLAYLLSFILGIGLLLFVMLCPSLIIKFYMKPSDSVLAIGPDIIRVYTMALPIASIGIVSSYYMQSILRRGLSILITALRGFILPIALVFILPAITGSYESIWYAIPLAEIITAIFSAVAVIYVNKRMKSPAPCEISNNSEG